MIKKFAKHARNVVGASAYGIALTRHRDAVRALTEILAARVRDVLPADTYDVTVKGFLLSVQETRTKRFVATSPGLALVGTDDAGEQQRRVCAVAAEALGEVAAPGDEPHVRVDATEIRIWWGASDEHEANVALAPIQRSDIGL